MSSQWVVVAGLRCAAGAVAIIGTMGGCTEGSSRTADADVSTAPKEAGSGGDAATLRAPDADPPNQDSPTSIPILRDPETPVATNPCDAPLLEATVVSSAVSSGDFHDVIADDEYVYVSAGERSCWIAEVRPAGIRTECGTTRGPLLRVSRANGAVEEILPGPLRAAKLEIAGGGLYVGIMGEPDVFPSEPPRVVRVHLADGTVETLSTGSSHFALVNGGVAVHRVLSSDGGGGTVDSLHWLPHDSGQSYAELILVSTVRELAPLGEGVVWTSDYGVYFAFPGDETPTPIELPEGHSVAGLIAGETMPVLVLQDELQAYGAHLISTTGDLIPVGEPQYHRELVHAWADTLIWRSVSGSYLFANPHDGTTRLIACLSEEVNLYPSRGEFFSAGYSDDRDPRDLVRWDLGLGSLAELPRGDGAAVEAGGVVDGGGSRIADGAGEDASSADAADASSTMDAASQ